MIYSFFPPKKTSTFYGWWLFEDAALKSFGCLTWLEFLSDTEVRAETSDRITCDLAPSAGGEVEESTHQHIQSLSTQLTRLNFYSLRSGEDLLPLICSQACPINTHRLQWAVNTKLSASTSLFIHCFLISRDCVTPSSSSSVSHLFFRVYAVRSHKSCRSLLKTSYYVNFQVHTFIWGSE